MLLRTWRSQCIQDVWCLGAGSCQQLFRNTGHWSRERPKISCPKRNGFRMCISSHFFFCFCFPPSGTSSSQWFKCNNVQQLQFHWSQDTTWTMSLSTSSTQGAAVKVGSDSIRSLDIFYNLNGGPVVPWQHCHGMGMNLRFLVIHLCGHLWCCSMLCRIYGNAIQFHSMTLNYLSNIGIDSLADHWNGGSSEVFDVTLRWRGRRLRTKSCNSVLDSSHQNRSKTPSYLLRFSLQIQVYGILLCLDNGFVSYVCEWMRQNLRD